MTMPDREIRMRTRLGVQPPNVRQVTSDTPVCWSCGARTVSVHDDNNATIFEQEHKMFCQTFGWDRVLEVAADTAARLEDETKREVVSRKELKATKREWQNRNAVLKLENNKLRRQVRSLQDRSAEIFRREQEIERKAKELNERITNVKSGSETFFSKAGLRRAIVETARSVLQEEGTHSFDEATDAAESIARGTLGRFSNLSSGGEGSQG